jgi:hypothetical protein
VSSDIIPNGTRVLVTYKRIFKGTIVRRRVGVDFGTMSYIVQVDGIAKVWEYLPSRVSPLTALDKMLDEVQDG